jgi:hypothetical protein
MGICSSLFNSSDPDKPTLYGRLLPTDYQYEEQQDRWNSLADYLVEDLKKKIRPANPHLATGFLQIWNPDPTRAAQHEFDIDLGIYFNMDSKPEDGLKPADMNIFGAKKP